MKLERSVGIVVAVVRDHVQELANKVQTLTGDVRYLKDRTYPLADELCLATGQLEAISTAGAALTAALTQSSRFLMNIGILRAPGDLRILVSCDIVCSLMFGGHISIFVMTHITGTFSASAIPRCSLAAVSGVATSVLHLNSLAHAD